MEEGIAQRDFCDRSIPMRTRYVSVPCNVYGTVIAILKGTNSIVYQYTVNCWSGLWLLEPKEEQVRQNFVSGLRNAKR